MSGSKLLLDTNVVLYFLKGDEFLLDLFSDKVLYLSFVSELELLGLQGISTDEEKQVRMFLDHVIIIDITQEIKQKTIALKRQHKIKLPDSIIAASSSVLNIPLLSSDKGFKKVNDIQLLFYQQ